MKVQTKVININWKDQCMAPHRITGITAKQFARIMKEIEPWGQKMSSVISNLVKREMTKNYTLIILMTGDIRGNN